MIGQQRRVHLLVLLMAVLFVVPHAHAQEQPATSVVDSVRATVVKTDRVMVDGQDEVTYTLKLLSGPQKGQEVVSGGEGGAILVNGVIYQPGDQVVVAVIDKYDGSTGYIIQEYHRLNSLWWLIGAFVLVVIWFSRWRGVRSLVGLALSFTIIIGWIVPRITNGDNPILVTIIGSTVILVAGFLLTEGRSRLTAAAMVGTVGTMLLIGGLSVAAVSIASLNGMTGDETLYLENAIGRSIDLRGLLLAGIIIGTLGILDDIAVSQAATVGELWTANPRLTRRQVYQAAMRVGRSHLVAIINTLTLAYAGSALPLLVLFNSSAQPWTSIVNSEIVATEIVRSIIGSIGLILALPLSTLAAVLLNVRGTHGHDHGHTHASSIIPRSS